MRKIAAIGDIHGCIDELKLLTEKLEWMSIDEIWSLGDICDRGPDSGACFDYMKRKKIQAVLGNHDDSLLRLWKKWKLTGVLPASEDKRRSLQSMTDEHFERIEQMPRLKVFDDTRVVLVHGGLWPMPFDQQPENVIRAQLIKPGVTGRTRWWGPDADSHKEGKSEAQSRAEGYSRWYELWQHPYDVAYGHSVWNQPFIHQNPGAGRTVGVDLGSCFGGSLTAAVFDGGEPWFVSVKSRKIHFEKSTRIHQEV
jgi:protein phosphatase